MPVESHPDCQEPDDRAATIWRYMDLTKFLSMLDKRVLYFASIAELRTVDPYEGSFFPSDLLSDGGPLLNRQDARRFMSSSSSDVRVSCWHINQAESDALWKLYLKSNDGIAVQTTCERLRQSLAAAPHKVYIGRVKYIDYDSDRFPPGSTSLFTACLHKRGCFEHERELRALIWEVGNARNGPQVPVDLDSLIEKVHVGPNAPPWVADVITSVSKKYGLTAQVVHSRLMVAPPY